jgi:hypothetical protein
MPGRIAPKHAAILASRPQDQITEEQQALLDRLMINCPDIIQLRGLALGFRDALIGHDGEVLQKWINEVSIPSSARSFDSTMAYKKISSQNRIGVTDHGDARLPCGLFKSLQGAKMKPSYARRQTLERKPDSQLNKTLIACPDRRAGSGE